MAKKTKQQVVIAAMNFSRFGAMSQLFIVDLFMKAGASHRQGETNVDFAARAMKETPSLVAELEAHANLMVKDGLKAVEAAFVESGAHRMFNPRAWFGVAEELTGKLADAA